jgi:hypothetical protein
MIILFLTTIYSNILWIFFPYIDLYNILFSIKKYINLYNPSAGIGRQDELKLRWL